MHDKAGKILRVNLSTGSIRGESAEAFERRFIGGRGVGAWILFNEMEPETKALDPESIMVLCTGPLTGTDFPGSGRLSIEAKNCNTNGINWANAGGHFGSELRRTGWSHIVVQGKSVEPVYLLIRDDKVELKSAAHLGGADVWETGNVIRSECGDPELQLATIGIAGENLVPMSIVVVDQHRAAGSGGLGAIMGSKNLKAIAVRGTGEIPVAHGEQFQALLRKIRAKLLDSALVKAFRELGTMGSYETPANNASIFPFRNTQDDFYANIESSSIAFSRWKKTGELLEVCSDCPIQCDRLVVEADEGPYKGVKVPLPHSNTQYTFGCRLDMKSPSNIIKAYELVSRYGLDNDQTGVAISWAFECYERGILTKKDTDGLDLTWGNDLAVIAMIRKIAMRDGFGRLLGEG